MQVKRQETNITKLNPSLLIKVKDLNILLKPALTNPHPNPPAHKPLIHPDPPINQIH